MNIVPQLFFAPEGGYCARGFKFDVRLWSVVCCLAHFWKSPRGKWTGVTHMPRGKILKMTVLGTFLGIFKTGPVWKSFRGEVNDLEGPVFGWFLGISKTRPVWKSFRGEVNDLEGPVFGRFWGSSKLNRFESHFAKRWTILRVSFFIVLGDVQNSTGLKVISRRGEQFWGICFWILQNWFRWDESRYGKREDQ